MLTYRWIYWVALAMAVQMSACSGEGGPSESELREHFVPTTFSNLPDYYHDVFDVEEFDVEASENVGDEAEPVWKTRVSVVLRLTEPFYQLSPSNIYGDTAIAEVAVPEGAEGRFFGYLTSRRSSDGWTHSVEIEEMPGPEDELYWTRGSGPWKHFEVAMDSFSGATVLPGDTEEAEEFLARQ